MWTEAGNVELLPDREVSGRKEASLTWWIQVLRRKEGVNVKVPEEDHLFFSISITTAQAYGNAQCMVTPSG